jgi:hypothetical protein
MTFPIPNPDKTGEVSVHTIEERTEYVLRGRFARIATANDLERELRDAVGGMCRGRDRRQGAYRSSHRFSYRRHSRGTGAA